jgi:hypothetical protein
MRSFYAFKKLDRAINEWKAVKYSVWMFVHDDDLNATMKALQIIGRHGYKGVKGIELLDELIGPQHTEMVVAKAEAVRKIAKQLKVRMSDVEESWNYRL